MKSNTSKNTSEKANATKAVKKKKRTTSKTQKQVQSSQNKKTVKKKLKKSLKKLEVNNVKTSKVDISNNYKKVMKKITSSDKQPRIYDEKKYLKTMKKKSKNNIYKIIYVFAALFIASFALVLKLEITHTKNGNDLEEYAQNIYTKTTNVESKRGSIYDTNGEALAINLEVYDMKAITDKKFECNIDGAYQLCNIKDVDKAADGISKALNLDAEGSAYIKKRLSYGVDNGKYEVTFGNYGKGITLSDKKALEKLNYEWLQFEPQTLRFYPYGDFASYVVGYTTKDPDDQNKLKGALGIEKALDGHLRGQDGKTTGLFDKYGIKLTEEQQSAIAKIDGTDVYLTLDSVVQTYLENAMESALKKYNIDDNDYDGLFTIVMDAKTGDILAAQSNPSFDPNVRKIENYTNYFTDFCFEPGSTFKTATVAAAKEAGVWNDTITEPTGSRSASTWGGAKIKDWNYGVGWGNITWKQGYYFSANTVMTYVMDKIPKQFWIDFVTKKLLIGSPVETQFISTPSCVFNPKYDVEYATTSFGQGMTVNALQMLRMYSALVEDGNMVTPHIVKEIKDSTTQEQIYTDEDLKVEKNVVTNDTSEHVRNLLRGVVEYDDGVNFGSGKAYLGSDYDIGMKTGTAQVAGANGKYINGKYIYSAMAAAPIDDPQLLMYTVAIRPTSENVPYKVFPQYVKETLDNALSYINSENRVIDSNDKLKTKEIKSYKNKEISTIKDKDIIKVGSGKVTKQYPKAGQKVATDQKTIIIGTENLKFPNLKGFTYNETVAVCNLLETTCEFENSGTKVKSAKVEGKDKYKIKME